MVTLVTGDLILRELEESDFDAVHAYASDPEVVKHEFWGPNTERDTRSFIERCIADQTQVPRKTYELAIVEQGALIGGAALRVEEREAELGYVLAKSAWGRGIATKVGAALIRFGFETLELDRIWADCDVENAASARVMEKLGMTHTLTIRDHKLWRGVWRHSYVYSIARVIDR